MKKILVFVALIALMAAIAACSAPPTPTPVPTPVAQPSPTAVPTKAPPTATVVPTVAPLSLDSLKNAEYTVEGPASGKAKLTAGTFKEPIAKSSAFVTVQMSDVTAVGDLNGDGAQDAAVILTVNSGGSGTFYYLYGVLNNKGTPQPTTPEKLGDRIKLKAMAIQGSEITVDFLTQGPKDAMANPTLTVTRKYKVQSGQLVSTTPVTPTPAVTATRTGVPVTPKPAATATLAKPPMPRGTINYHWNDAGVDRLSALNVETGKVTPLTVSGPVMDITQNTNAHIGEWSPDGSRFAYIFAGALGASNVLKIIDANGNTTTPYSSDTGGGLSSPTWSSDGTRIAFAKVSGNQQTWSIVIINADGTKCSDIFECLIKQVAGEQYRGGLSWSKQNFLSVGFNTTGSNDVYTMGSDGGTVVNLTNNPADDTSPVWSPDGKQIAFASNRDGRSQIYVMNANGSGAHRLLVSTFSDSSPTWSPDGKWIAFASTREGQTNIYMVDINGNNLTPLSKDGGDHPMWSR